MESFRDVVPYYKLHKNDIDFFLMRAKLLYRYRALPAGNWDLQTSSCSWCPRPCPSWQSSSPARGTDPGSRPFHPGTVDLCDKISIIGFLLFVLESKAAKMNNISGLFALFFYGKSC